MTSNGLTNCLFLAAAASNSRLLDDLRTTANKQDTVGANSWAPDQIHSPPSCSGGVLAALECTRAVCQSHATAHSQSRALFAISDFIHHATLPLSLHSLCSPPRTPIRLDSPIRISKHLTLTCSSSPANPHLLLGPGRLWCGRMLWRWRSGFWACWPPGLNAPRWTAD